MAYPTKIVTCCYCGVRAALVLKGKGRHELACSACGAPLQDLKMLKKTRVQDQETPGSHGAIGHRRRESRAQPRHKKRKTRRKGLFAKVVEEAFDVLEDIFD